MGGPRVSAGAHRAINPDDGPTVHVQPLMHGGVIRPPAADTPTGVVRASLVGVILELEGTGRGTHRRRLAPETRVAIAMGVGVLIMLAPLTWLMWPLL